MNLSRYFFVLGVGKKSNFWEDLNLVFTMLQ